MSGEQFAASSVAMRHDATCAIMISSSGRLTSQKCSSRRDLIDSGAAAAVADRPSGERLTPVEVICSAFDYSSACRPRYLVYVKMAYCSPTEIPWLLSLANSHCWLVPTDTALYSIKVHRDWAVYSESLDCTLYRDWHFDVQNGQT